MGAAPLTAVERARANLTTALQPLLTRAPNGYRSPERMAQLRDELRPALHSLPQDEYRALRLNNAHDELVFLQQFIDQALAPDPLEPLLADPAVTEIMINGPEEIFVERHGRLERAAAKFQSANHLLRYIEQQLSAAGLAVNESTAFCDASLPDGTRLNVIIPPLILNGPAVTIRCKMPAWTMESYLATGALSPEGAAFLTACVKARVNIVVAGGTSSGKTTLVGVLAGAIPQDQRIITIENVPELELGRPHWLRLVARTGNADGRGEVPLRTLVRNALRMRPDRLILGEARGGEALDVVQAMHTGHDGVITVLHANSPHAALGRLETLMLMSGVELPPAACRMQIADAVDVVVYLMRCADGSRKIGSIAQVAGAGPDGFQIEELFTFEAEGFRNGKLAGALRATGVKPRCLKKFQLNNVAIPLFTRGERA